jgi:hypothetical protein
MAPPGAPSMLDIKDLPTRISLGVIAVPLCSRTLRLRMRSGTD